MHYFTPIDWDDIRLVVFDVDGTLYRRRSLHLRIARDILIYTLWNRDFRVISVLTKYRAIRERLADEQVMDFERILIAETATATANSPEMVRTIATEWLEQRPLRYLASCRYRGLPQLFANLRLKGKSIGILSDYPVKPKLLALELSADYAVFSAQEGIGVLKPHPRGLECLLAAAGVKARETMFVGDRVDRDGLAAQRAGVRALIRSSKPIKGWQTFTGFEDRLFSPLFSS